MGRRSRIKNKRGHGAYVRDCFKNWKYKLVSLSELRCSQWYEGSERQHLRFQRLSIRLTDWFALNFTSWQTPLADLH